MIGYEDSEDALEASRTGMVNPGVIELADGSFAGRCDSTIPEDGTIRSWARVPSGLVEIKRSDESDEWIVVEGTNS